MPNHTQITVTTWSKC